MSEIDDEAERLSESMAEAFEAAGVRIETAMRRAAETGETEFARMSDAILRDLARLAIDQVIARPMEAMMQSALSGLPFLGARAEGGPVQAGGAYWVGEHGPELFQPNQAGQITPGPATVHVHLSLPSHGRGQPVLSERSLARHLARAVARGQAQL